MVTVAFTDGDTLICVISSKSKNGVYLVEVKPIDDNKLLVSHVCPAQRFNTNCSHVEEAVGSYNEWKWWENGKEIITESRHIMLQEQLEQIPVPGTVRHALVDLIRVDSYAP